MSRSGKPRKIQTMQHNHDDKVGGRLSVFPAFAADNQSKEYRGSDLRGVDRLPIRPHPASLLALRGPRACTGPSRCSWIRAPRRVRCRDSRCSGEQDGIVGVTWYDTRDSKDGSQFHEYFTASLDGGKSFLPPVRVSSAPSTPLGPGNMNMGADDLPAQGNHRPFAGLRWEPLAGRRRLYGAGGGQGWGVPSVLGGRADGDVPDLHRERLGGRSTKGEARSW